MTKPWALHREKLLSRPEWLKLHRFLRDRAALAERRGTKRAIKEYVIISTAAYSGLRRSEIAALRCRDLHLLNGDNPYIVVRRGKGGRYREVVISASLRRALRKFLKWKAHWGERVSGDALLFLSQRGAYTGSGIARVFRNNCKRAGVTQLGVHSLRHFFCSNLYAATKDLKLIQAQAGHARLTTTQVYLQVDDADAAAGMSAFDQLIAREDNGASRSEPQTRRLHAARPVWSRSKTKVRLA